MAQKKQSMTQAMRALRAAGVEPELHEYKYEHKGGTAVAARELGQDEHCIIKTLVFADDKGAPMLVLMHGDREVSVKNLARELGAKRVSPVDEASAQRLTGYQVGGISPFGTRTAMPVHAQASIFELTEIFINAGRRGLLARMSPEVLRRILKAAPVEAAV